MIIIYKFKSINKEKTKKKKVGIERREGNLGSVGDALELTVPVVLALDHAASVEFSALELHRHHVPRSLVEQLHRNSQTPAHASSLSNAKTLLLHYTQICVSDFVFVLYPIFPNPSTLFYNLFYSNGTHTKMGTRIRPRVIKFFFYFSNFFIFTFPSC